MRSAQLSCLAFRPDASSIRTKAGAGGNCVVQEHALEKIAEISAPGSIA
jgi:hypothetical protein